ncbi:MAG: hypothetical protein JZU67_07350, partial [Burkholderiaceae bacterium]|nr:hypothetical protein [Burkholderiaceae bacterium]
FEKTDTGSLEVAEVLERSQNSCMFLLYAGSPDLSSVLVIVLGGYLRIMEVARGTSLVHYAPKSSFSHHHHDLRTILGTRGHIPHLSHH